MLNRESRDLSIEIRQPLIQLGLRVPDLLKGFFFL
jgi:hypothetical protein